MDIFNYKLSFNINETLLDEKDDFGASVFHDILKDNWYRQICKALCLTNLADVITNQFRELDCGGFYMNHATLN